MKLIEKFIIAVCQISIGKQVFGYSENKAMEYLRQKRLDSHQTEVKSIDSKKLIEIQPNYDYNETPKVTVSYR